MERAFDREPRSSVFFAATLIVGEKRIEAKVRNFSEGGAYVKYANDIDLPAGTKGILERNKLRIPFEIAWHKDGEAGLKFEAVLEREKILERETNPFENLTLPKRVFIRPEDHRRPALKMKSR